MILKSPTKGNRIIFAYKYEQLEQSFLANEKLEQSLRTLGVELSLLLPLLSDKIDWDTSVKPLTDQYSPANLLNQ